MKGRREPPPILRVQPVDEDHQVVSVGGSSENYQRRPCAQCPWRVDTTGGFPAEAFRVSAPTAYDIMDAILHAVETGHEPGFFSCHMAGIENTSICAGFLLRGAENSLAVRRSKRDFTGVEDAGIALHPTYRAMAIANGVSPDDPALAKCRDAGTLGRKLP